MFHKQWDILLDSELLHAMEDGIRILCPDNVTRLFFPWMFTYSADYPEKYVLVTIARPGTDLTSFQSSCGHYPLAWQQTLPLVFDQKM